ncbi:MAG: sigma-70 family RNA polymerase sigma factor [Nannocystaceae bacterium]
MEEPEAQVETEGELRRLHEGGDLEGAATLALRRYGPELLGFLAAAGRGAVDVDEVFGAFSEALWRSLPRFRWQSSFRTWAYAVARHTLLQAHRRARVVARRQGGAVSRLEAVAIDVRTTTAPYLRTSVKDDLGRLRAELDDDEQALLILRIDRHLAWLEIARIMADPADASIEEAAELRRRAAALRKRFERLKERLSALIKAGRASSG